jgi:hypothetical protein
MIKALLWKEWREQRGIAFAGAAVALLIPLMTIGIASASNAPDYFLDVTDIVPFLFGMVVWPLFAALAGATVNSESASLASAGFLFSRPVPRAVLWLIKVAIGVVAIGFVVSLSYYAALRVDVWVGGWGFRFPFSSDPFSWPSDHIVQAMAVGALYVTFCASIFLSSFMRRPIAAAIGGLGLAIAAQFAAVFMAGRIGASSLGAGAEHFVAVSSIAVSVVLLLASLYVFHVTGIAGTDDARCNARRAWAGIGASLPFIVVLAGFTSTRITADAPRAWFALAVPGSDVSILSLQRNPFSGNSLWAAQPGHELRRLTGRIADAIAVSPDGRWLVYSSRLSPIGLRASTCQLRAVRLDGGEDRLLIDDDSLAASRWCYYEGSFDSDGQRLAMRVSIPSNPDRLLVTDLSGGWNRFIDISEIESRDYWGFIPHWVTDDEVLLYSRYDDSGGYWRIIVDSGAIENVYSAIEGYSLTPLAESANRLLVREWERRDYPTNPLDPEPQRESTKLITVTDGSSDELRPLCKPVGEGWQTLATMSSDGRYVYYACRPRLPRGEEWDYIDPEEVFRGSLMRRDLETDEDVVVAELDGYVYGVDASPDATRFVILLADPRREVPVVRPGGSMFIYEPKHVTYRNVLVQPDGSVRPLDIARDWSFTGWFGNQRLVLRGRSPRNGVGPIAYLELHDRAVELRVLHNPGEAR